MTKIWNKLSFPVSLNFYTYQKNDASLPRCSRWLITDSKWKLSLSPQMYFSNQVSMFGRSFFACFLILDDASTYSVIYGKTVSVINIVFLCLFVMKMRGEGLFEVSATRAGLGRIRFCALIPYFVKNKIFRKFLKNIHDFSTIIPYLAWISR